MKVSATLFGLKHYVQKTREHYTIPNNISRHLMFEWEDRKSKYLARGHHVWTKYNRFLSLSSGIILQPFGILRKLRNKA